MGDVLDEAIIEPSCGNLSVDELTVLQPVSVDSSRSCHVSYPLLTPSICRSIHHMPGVPIMDHRAAFLPIAPIGSHCRKKKYDRLNARRSGIRIVKRKTWTGRYAPAGSIGMGRNGAMPVPVSPSVGAVHCLHSTDRTSITELREFLHESYLQRGVCAGKTVVYKRYCRLSKAVTKSIA